MALRPLLPSLDLFNIPAFQSKLPASWRVPIPLLTLSSLAFPFLSQIPNPSSILRDIWDGILRAVPKKKTPYGRSRSRRLVNKGIKDILSIVRCPSCGKPKRSHFLCPYCVQATRLFFKADARRKDVKLNAERMKALATIKRSEAEPKMSQDASSKAEMKAGSTSETYNENRRYDP